MGASLCKPSKDDVAPQQSPAGQSVGNTNAENTTASSGAAALEGNGETANQSATLDPGASHTIVAGSSANQPATLDPGAPESAVAGAINTTDGAPTSSEAGAVQGGVPSLQTLTSSVTSAVEGAPAVSQLSSEAGAVEGGVPSLQTLTSSVTSAVEGAPAVSQLSSEAGAVQGGMPSDMASSMNMSDGLTGVSNTGAVMAPSDVGNGATGGAASGITDVTSSAPNPPDGSLGVSSGTWGDVSSSFGDSGAVGEEMPSNTNP